VDESTKIVTTRPKNYCGSDDCDKYYACTSDVCVETTNDFDGKFLNIFLFYIFNILLSFINAVI